jgi:hypothetical protein
VYAEQQSGLWRFRATDNQRLRSCPRLKGLDARNLPEPVKVATNPDDILRFIKDFNPGLNTQHWRVLDRLPEAKAQGLLLVIHWASFTTIKNSATRYSHNSFRKPL